MGDRMRQIPFGQLMSWALNEYSSEGTVFGVSKLYAHDLSEHQSSRPELPFGPAAGPHTQLAQNLIAAYVAGARFFELKTVQVLDGEDLPVSKPCIYAQDEGYNVEWSTELYVPQALDEYVKGWFAINLLSRELGLGSDDGFVFNMSVGYDLKGIKTLKIDSFIEGLKNAEDTGSWNTCRQWVYDNLTRFKYVDKHMLDCMKPAISDSITLSTLHGCPPDEIERIAGYLLRDKGLHTFIKCNPTLLGYEYARETLGKLGYDYIDFTDKHFKNDLQFGDAVPMLKRLKNLADSLKLDFGVKLTNTFPVQIPQGGAVLPGEEMYMSGRALFPLSIEVARRLSDAFDGKLRISYSGGADARNISDIIAAGIRPVTLATTLLKPGGYERLHQIASSLGNMKESEYDEGIDPEKLRTLADGARSGALYKKGISGRAERKIDKELPLLDCAASPCLSGCPLEQDIPAYLRLMSDGKHLEALEVITERNPLPHITGTICSHNCMNKCVRYYYDESIDIRAVKLAAAKSAFKQLMAKQAKTPAAPETGEKIAVVGGGPAGLSAAYFLARAGCKVTVFEKRASLGGVVRHVIPWFRIDDEAIDNDIAFILSKGIDIRLNTNIIDIKSLQNEGFRHIIIATGAWGATELKLKEGNAVDALEYLEGLKKNTGCHKHGRSVIVIGGGNTAMDAARAAIRIEGVEKVTVLYRRTKRYMPAAPEEIELAGEDGVEITELAAPLELKDGVLTYEIMELKEPDSSGRPGVAPTGKTDEIACDLLISAIGNIADKNLQNGQNIRIIGDAARGPATIAEAIADAIKCAEDITGTTFDKYAGQNINPCQSGINQTDEHDSAQLSMIPQYAPVLGKRGVIYKDIKPDDEPCRCLECSTVCNICAEVCPNRANICVMVNNRPQIVHIDFLCNECGNCAVFCPYRGAPYLDKFTYFVYDNDFDNSDNPGFLACEDGTIHVRLDGKVTKCRDGTGLPPEIWHLIEASLNKFQKWFI